MTRTTRRLVWLVAILAALALAMTVTACGSDDDGDRNQGAVTAKSGDGVPTRSGGDPNGTPEEQIRAIYDGLVDALYEHELADACARLSASARRELGDKVGCEKRLDEYIQNLGGGFIQDRPKVVEVTISGRRALARAKTQKSNAYSIPFVKAGGGWKVDGGFETAGL